MPLMERLMNTGAVGKKGRDVAALGEAVDALMKEHDETTQDALSAIAGQAGTSLNLAFSSVITEMKNQASRVINVGLETEKVASKTAEEESQIKIKNIQ